MENPLKNKYVPPEFSVIFEKSFAAFSLSIYSKVEEANFVFLVGDCCGVVFDTAFAVQENETMQDLIERCITATQSAFAGQAIIEKQGRAGEGEPTWLMNQ